MRKQLLRDMPTWASNVLKQVFIGVARDGELNAWTSVGPSPYVSIGPRLDVALLCALGVHEAVTGVLRGVLEKSGNRRVDPAEALEVVRGKPRAWADVEAWLELTNQVRFAPDSDLTQLRDAMFKRMAGAPRDEQDKRMDRYRTALRVALAHEVGHVVLGHVGPPPLTAALNEVEDLASGQVVVNQEAQCDLLGAEWGVLGLARREATSQRRVAALSRGIDSLSILFAALHRSGERAVLPIDTRVKGYPSPSQRFDIAKSVVENRMRVIAATVTGPDYGDDGPGFCKRQLEEGVPQSVEIFHLELALLDLLPPG